MSDADTVHTMHAVHDDPGRLGDPLAQQCPCSPACREVRVRAATYRMIAVHADKYLARLVASYLDPVCNPTGVARLDAMSARAGGDLRPRGGTLRAKWLAQGWSPADADRLLSGFLGSLWRDWLHGSAAPSRPFAIHVMSGASGCGKTLLCDVAAGVLRSLGAKVQHLPVHALSTLMYRRRDTGEWVQHSTDYLILHEPRQEEAIVVLNMLKDSPCFPSVRAVIVDESLATLPTLPSIRGAYHHRFPPRLRPRADTVLERACGTAPEQAEMLRHVFGLLPQADADGR